MICEQTFTAVTRVQGQDSIELLNLLKLIETDGHSKPGFLAQLARQGKDVRGNGLARSTGSLADDIAHSFSLAASIVAIPH
jgi:hypothetical protein